MKTFTTQQLANDTLETLSLIEKKVTVKTKNDSIDGYLITVDPVTASLVVVVGSEEKLSNLIIITGHSIESVTVFDESISATLKAAVAELLGEKQSTESDTEIAQRKEKLITWLKANYITPEEQEDGSLRILNVLTIKSPFTSNDCVSGNEIVLGKVKKILERMPKQ